MVVLGVWGGLQEVGVEPEESGFSSRFRRPINRTEVDAVSATAGESFSNQIWEISATGLRWPKREGAALSCHCGTDRGQGVERRGEAGEGSGLDDCFQNL